MVRTNKKERQSSNFGKTKYLTVLALFSALIIAVQFICSHIPTIGTVSITLVLVPIVISGILLDYKASAILGFVFGIISMIMSITGTDPGGNLMFQYNPIATIILCLGKGTLAGLTSGLVYKYTAARLNNERTSIFLAAFIAPTVNTGLFTLCGITIFNNVLNDIAKSCHFTLTGLLLFIICTNYLVELLLNIIICPTLGLTLKHSKLTNRYLN